MHGFCSVLPTCDSENKSLSPVRPGAATSKQQLERARLGGQPTRMTRILQGQCPEALGCGGSQPGLHAIDDNANQASLARTSSDHCSRTCRPICTNLPSIAHLQVMPNAFARSAAARAAGLVPGWQPEQSSPVDKQIRRQFANKTLRCVGARTKN